MGLGVDRTIICDRIHFLPFSTDLGDRVLFVLLELLDDARHDIDEDHLAIESDVVPCYLLMMS